MFVSLFKTNTDRWAKTCLGRTHGNNKDFPRLALHLHPFWYYSSSLYNISLLPSPTFFMLLWSLSPNKSCCLFLYLVYISFSSSPHFCRFLLFFWKIFFFLNFSFPHFSDILPPALSLLILTTTHPLLFAPFECSHLPFITLLSLFFLLNTFSCFFLLTISIFVFFYYFLFILSLPEGLWIDIEITGPQKIVYCEKMSFHLFFFSLPSTQM